MAFRDRKVIFMVRGGNLWVKLSYRTGILTGTETYSSRPSDQYWDKNYGQRPVAELEFTETVAFKHADGYFILHVGETIHDFDATELVGNTKNSHLPKSHMRFNFSQLSKEASIRLW